MPALYIFGSPSSFAGDDLQLLSIMTIAFRIVQLGLLAFVAWYLLIASVPFGDALTSQHGSNNYDDNEEDPCVQTSQAMSKSSFRAVLIAYCCGTLAHITASFIIEASVIAIASRGTPTQPEKRKGLIPLLLIKAFPLAFLLLIVTALGAVSMAYVRALVECQVNADQSSNDDEAKTRKFPASWLFWCMFLLLLAQILESLSCIVEASYRLYDCWIIRKCCQSTNSALQEDSDEALEQRDEVWERKCLFCCKTTSLLTCFLFGGHRIQRSDFGHVGSAFTDFFDHGGFMDVVTSDILAGLILLLLVQKFRRRRSRYALMAITKTEDCTALWQEVEYDTDILALQVRKSASFADERGQEAAPDNRTSPASKEGGNSDDSSFHSCCKSKRHRPVIY